MISCTDEKLRGEPTEIVSALLPIIAIYACGVQLPMAGRGMAVTQSTS